jgi:hypothetical protein
VSKLKGLWSADDPAVFATGDKGKGAKLKHLHDEYMPEHHLTFNGSHHEIYLSDPRRRARLKTILRQPVKNL